VAIVLIFILWFLSYCILASISQAREMCINLDLLRTTNAHSKAKKE